MIGDLWVRNQREKRCREMVRNLFEFGGKEQIDIIKPFQDHLIAYDPGERGSIDDFVNYFINELTKALSVRSEREKIPEWVCDKEDYIIKSEMNIAVMLFRSVLSRKNPPVSGENIENKEINLTELLKSNPDASSHYLPNLIKALNLKLSDIGTKRQWDLEALQYQLFKSYGVSLGTIFSFLMKPRQLMGIDYN
jgi:hypothetical protein